MNSELIHRYLEQSLSMLNHYNQSVYPKPLHLYLRTYFREKKRGSRDRRTLRDLTFAICRYAWLSEPKSFTPETFIKDHRVLEPIMKYAPNPEEWPLPKSEFPEAIWRTHCSEQIDINLEHYLTFDRVWLVPDGANLQQLEHALKKRGIPVLDKDEELKTVQVNTEEITDWQGEKPWRVQDYGARSLVMTLPIEKRDLVWDCCAGSGGKSLSLLHKTNFLNVSDKRKKVLEPLMKRSYSGKQVKVDSLNPLVNKSHEFMNAEYDWIVADVPCSGSGTWRKNPEHFIGFGSNQIKDYQTTQRKIVESLIPVMSDKTKLVYMTCSVFSEENEGQLDFFKSLGLNVQKSEYIRDAKRDSDQFYRCILVKSE